MPIRPPLLVLPAAMVLMALAGCRQPPAAASAPGPVVRAYAQFSAGDTLETVQAQLGLDQYPLRYRTGMPDGVMGMIYFLEDGNLHVDARKIGDTWVILSVPILEPSTLSATERLAEWDNGSDPQNLRGRSQK